MFISLMSAFRVLSTINRYGRPCGRRHLILVSFPFIIQVALRGKKSRAKQQPHTNWRGVARSTNERVLDVCWQTPGHAGFHPAQKT